MNFQEILLQMQAFWSARGALLQQPYDVEKGAGTMNPDTFFRVLGPEPWRVAYCEPSRRPGDGRYGENPFRLYKHYQVQVILKPAPEGVQDEFLQSLAELGIGAARHDIRFEEDNWEAPTLGAAGVGWQVLLDGMEITQFTYFQQAGGRDLDPVSAELTYGVERIGMFLNGVDNSFDLPWTADLRYGEVRREEEIEFSRYSFEEADVRLHFDLFARYEAEADRLLERRLYLPAYDYCLKCSHAFNVLESRGALSVTERIGFIQRVRRLAVGCADRFLERREELGYPLLRRPEGKA
ncbi:MAG: glycine--tRNA ligase subunit alpha [Acidobacteria bacterium]|nr:glycine--tRNA ligase subunit alpha [Acidobacteriota bacterium]